MSASIEIDALDEQNRWLDLNAAMSEEGWTVDKSQGEQASFSELLLPDPTVAYHQRDKQERAEVEEKLLDALGR